MSVCTAVGHFDPLAYVTARGQNDHLRMIIKTLRLGFRKRIGQELSLCQILNLTHPGLLSIRSEKYHHGIRCPINHDPPFAGFFKTFFFFRCINHSLCPFITVPGGTEPDREKEDRNSSCKRNRKRGCKYSILPLILPAIIRKF